MSINVLYAAFASRYGDRGPSKHGVRDCGCRCEEGPDDEGKVVAGREGGELVLPRGESPCVVTAHRSAPGSMQSKLGILTALAPLRAA
jgi:hypothetical protein